MRLNIGLSPCPNDTWIAHGLLTGAVRADGVDLRIEFADVQVLNEALLAGQLAISKGSFALALQEAARLTALPVGAAIGFGVGPLLLGRPGLRVPPHPGAKLRILAPGRHTTAALLFQLFDARRDLALEHVRFDEIMPRLARGEADYGIVIHEGRFTYAGYGLELIEDLGARYERATGAAVPLGGLFAQRAVPTPVLSAVAAALRRSLDHARQFPAEAFVTMRQYAQELNDEVIARHVDLYVNEWTRDLGVVGQRAIGTLESLARSQGLFGADHPRLEIRPPSSP